MEFFLESCLFFTTFVKFETRFNAETIWIPVRFCQNSIYKNPRVQNFNFLT